MKFKIIYDLDVVLTQLYGSNNRYLKRTFSLVEKQLNNLKSEVDKKELTEEEFQNKQLEIMGFLKDRLKDLFEGKDEVNAKEKKILIQDKWEFYRARQILSTLVKYFPQDDLKGHPLWSEEPPEDQQFDPQLNEIIKEQLDEAFFLLSVGKNKHLLEICKQAKAQVEQVKPDFDKLAPSEFAEKRIKIIKDNLIGPLKNLLEDKTFKNEDENEFYRARQVFFSLDRLFSSPAVEESKEQQNNTPKLHQQSDDAQQMNEKIESKPRLWFSGVFTGVIGIINLVSFLIASLVSGKRQTEKKPDDRGEFELTSEARILKATGQGESTSISKPIVEQNSSDALVNKNTTNTTENKQEAATTPSPIESKSSPPSSSRRFKI